MSDTPRTDAVRHNLAELAVFARQLERELTQEKHHTEAVMRTLRQTLGIDVGRDCLEEVGRLKEAEVEAQHRIRTIIEERDRARIQADHKWRLREEFEALLGTSDVETGVERVKKAQRGAAKYEYVRKLNPREFTMLTLFCATADVRFDAEVDRRRNQA